MTGRDAREDIKGLPGAVGSHLVPGGTLARLGKGSRGAKNVARAVRGVGSVGGNMVQTLIENPDADFEDHKKAAVENLIASMGMRAAGGTARAIVGGAAHAFSPSRGDPGTPGTHGQPPAGASIPETATQSPASGAAQPGAGQPASASQVPPSGPLQNNDGGDGHPLSEAELRRRNGGPPQPPPSAQLPALPPLSSSPEDQAYEAIQRLQSKSHDRELSPEEKIELDRHKRTVAAADQKRLEAEEQALRAGKPPGELQPHEQEYLAEANRKLAMPAPGTPPQAQTTTVNGVQPASPSTTSTGPGSSSGGGDNGSATYTVDGGGGSAPDNSSSTHSSSGSLPPGASSIPAAPGIRPGADTHNGAPDRAAQPDGTNPRGIELPGGRRGGGPEDSNLVMAGVGGGGNGPLTAHAAPPPATAGGAAPGAIGQTMNGPASPAHPDAPQGSAGGGGASGGPLPPAPGQPPPSTPSDSGGQSIKPGNATDGKRLADHTDGETPIKKLDFAGSLRRIANINKKPEEQNQHPITQAELAHSREVVRARMAEIKAKGGNVTLAEATDLDLAEKSEAAELKTKLENEHRKNGQLTADQASQLSQAQATLARHAPMDPGPPPQVPQAVNDVRNLTKKAADGPLTAKEAHKFANAQRAVARRGLENLDKFSGPLSEPQQHARDRARKAFQAILHASPYTADLPSCPPRGYDPDSKHGNWYPCHGEKPVMPPQSAFTPGALSLTEHDIETQTEKMKTKGHAWGRHGPEVLEGQLEDRARFKADPMSQTTRDWEGGEHGCAEHATQFTSARAMVQVVKTVENHPDFAATKARVLAFNNTPSVTSGTTPPVLQFKLRNITLEQALGPDYLQHVRGKTKTPSGEIIETDLEQGKITAIYLFDKKTGNFHLHTLYPDTK